MSIYEPCPPITRNNYIQQRVHVKWCRKNKLGKKYPCATCAGRGQILDPSTLGLYEIQPDYMCCPTCKGNTYGSKDDFWRDYLDAREEYKQQVEASKQQIQICQKAIKKLSSEEIEALGLEELKSQLEKIKPPVSSNKRPHPSRHKDPVE